MNCLTPPHGLLRLPPAAEWSRNDIQHTGGEVDKQSVGGEEK